LKRAALTRERVAAIAAAAVGFALVLGATNAASEDSSPISRAETLLFMSPHLKQVQPPSRLHYAFHKSGTLEKGFSDTVEVDITSAADGTRKGVARFFTGERKISYPEVDHVEGNPVLLFYLEREIREMSRLTGGQPNHFRKMIRTALAESAQIKGTEIHFGGRAMPAQQIKISPYASDEFRDRYPRLVSKQYVFTICETIPGVVYEIRGLVPAAGDAAQGEAVMDETLTFTSAGAPE
jgi:hypothetical protein